MPCSTFSIIKGERLATCLSCLDAMTKKHGVEADVVG